MDIVFLLFMTFFQQLETSDALQCSSDSFPRMVIYILCVENCQNYILTHSCLPIAGRLFCNVRKFHGLRISECNTVIKNFLNPKGHQNRHWFKSYSHFDDSVDGEYFAYWWSCIWKGLRLHISTKAFLHNLFGT